MELFFTCLNTKSIHIKYSCDLSTDCFILLLRRFLTRMKHVNIVRSDNGKNFVDVIQEINNAIKNFEHGEITIYLIKYQIIGNFNPPLSSWVRSCLESLIKTIKRCLYVILKNTITTVETRITILCEVMYIVKIPPLLPISYNINYYDVMTPNNFY